MKVAPSLIIDVCVELDASRQNKSLIDEISQARQGLADVMYPFHAARLEISYNIVHEVSWVKVTLLSQES